MTSSFAPPWERSLIIRRALTIAGVRGVSVTTTRSGKTAVRAEGACCAGRCGTCAGCRRGRDAERKLEAIILAALPDLNESHFGVSVH